MFLPSVVSLLSLTLAVGLNVLLAVLIWQNHPKTGFGKAFWFFSVSSSLWLIMIFISTSRWNEVNVLLAARLSIFFATPHSVSLYFIANALPGYEFTLSRNKLMALLLLTILMMAFTLTPYVFKSVEVSDASIMAIPGWGVMLFGFFNNFFFAAAIYSLAIKIKEAGEKEKKQLLYVLWGMIIMVVSIILTIFFPIVFKGNAAGVQFAPFYVMAFSGLIAFAIIRHKLFGIKLIAVQVLASLFLFTVIAEVFIAQLFRNVYFQLFSVALVIFLGILLSRYIGREVKSKERADNLAHSLQNANDILNKINQERAELISFVAEHLKEHPELKDSAKMVSLSNLFNTVAELEQGRITLSFSPVNLNQLAEEAIQEAGDLFKNKNITLVLHKSSTLGEISIDREKIRQVVMKLLDNAAHYSPANSMVEIFVRSVDDSASLCVKDNGIGFVKGEWENLFDKFYRSRQAAEVHAGGTGLSMYWCRKIIEAHGGRVLRHSMGINRGAEFGFYLPKSAKRDTVIEREI